MFNKKHVFKHIVLAHDGSENADRTVPFVRELAGDEDAKVTIVHVEQEFVGKGGGGPINAAEDSVVSGIEAQAKELSDDGIDTDVRKTAILLGGPAAAIAKVADEIGADLIVVGGRGRSGVTGVLVGSVSQRLLHIASQPVLVVPEKAAVPAREAAPAG